MQTIQSAHRGRLRALSLSVALSATTLAAQAADCASGDANIGISTCTVPAGVTKVTIAAWGGGGGGGYGQNGAGGGGGGYCGQSFTVTPGETLTITVGKGGVGGYVDLESSSEFPGQYGGASSVLSSASGIALNASGGAGAAYYDDNPPGGSCTGATGYPGGNGGAAAANEWSELGSPGGGGGGSATPSAAGDPGGDTEDGIETPGAGGSGAGRGGDGGGFDDGGGARSGQPGSVPGGGGGGGAEPAIGETYGNGGDGADGRVTLDFTVPEVVVNSTVTAIPTLGEWGLMLLAGLLGLLGVRRGKSRH